MDWTFGKIEDSDVVDMANMTLQEDLMRELTGLRCSYAAVLIASKKMDLGYL